VQPSDQGLELEQKQAVVTNTCKLVDFSDEVRENGFVPRDAWRLLPASDPQNKGLTRCDRNNPP
jgi:hypothetical protein